MSEQHTLISPLGMSPGAVSGVAFALRRGVSEGDNIIHYPISRVVTVGTSHSEVKEASQCLQPLFAAAGIEYHAEFITQEELKGNDQSVPNFVTRLGDLFDRYRDEKLHIAVTGGRSGMGALAGLAASLYGADFLWHLWVPETIEAKGHIRFLQKPFTPDNEYLNPKEYELVSLPFVDLSPLHEDFWKYYHSGDLTVDAQVRPLLAQLLGGQMQLGDVFPGGVSLRTKQTIEAELIGYEALPEDVQEERQARIVQLLRQAGIVAQALHNQLQDVLELDLPLSKLLTIAEDEAEEHDFWMYLLDKQARIETAVRAERQPLDDETLLDTLHRTYSKEEIRTLCLILRVDYDDLGGEGKEGKIRELILRLQRRQRLPELAALAAEQRPREQWWLEPVEVNLPVDLFFMRGLTMWVNQRNGRKS